MLTFRFRFLILGIVLALFLVLAACGGVQDQDRITIIERKQTQGEAVTKILQANNCDGKTEMKQDLQAVNQYNHDIEIKPNPGVSVNRKAVEDEIRSYYKLPQTQSDAVCVVPVQVPAGGYYTFELEWTEIYREGDFELQQPDDKPEGTYRFRQSMLCEVVGQQAQTCP